MKDLFMKYLSDQRYELATHDSVYLFVSNLFLFIIFYKLIGQ